MKGVTHGDQPTENHYVSSESSVSAHCVAVRLSTLLFWFTLTILKVFLAVAGSCFQRKSSKNPLYTTCLAL